MYVKVIKNIPSHTIFFYKRLTENVWCGMDKLGVRGNSQFSDYAILKWLKDKSVEFCEESETKEYRNKLVESAKSKLTEEEIEALKSSNV